MADKEGTTVERTTLYTWAQTLGEDARRQLSAMPDPFKDAAAAALKALKAASARRSRLAETISKMTKALVVADEDKKKAEERLGKYADRIRTAVNAASLPIEEE